MPTPSNRRPPRGFTLLELLVVIGIISLLVGLTVTIIPKVKRAAYGASTSAQLASIATSIQSYYSDFRAYPGPLANGQLGGTYYATVPPISVTDPNNSNAVVKLTFLNCDTAATTAQITGAENLVLGLLGGLEFTYTGNTLGSPINKFEYNPANLFPDGTTPAPKGPLILDPNAPKRFGAYLQVNAGDLSISKTTAGLPTMFTDEASRSAADSPIPEFVDKFSQQMPILFLRANVGGKAVAGVAGNDDKGNPLTQTNSDASTTAVTPQYDLANVLGYTKATAANPGVGTAPNDPLRSHHGLQGLGSITDSVQGDKATPTGWYNAGLNGLAYFKDPNNSGTSNTPDFSKSPPLLGNARQKDAFILISAGPDGIYGTADDIVYPGGAVTP